MNHIVIELYIDCKGLKNKKGDEKSIMELFTLKTTKQLQQFLDERKQLGTLIGNCPNKAPVQILLEYDLEHQLTFIISDREKIKNMLHLQATQLDAWLKKAEAKYKEALSAKAQYKQYAEEFENFNKEVD